MRFAALGPEDEYSYPAPREGEFLAEKRSRLPVFVSPSFLVLSLLMFPLPWIELRCNAPVAGKKVMLSQSGLQAAYAGVTLDPSLDAYVTQTRKKQEEAARLSPEFHARPSELLPAPLMMLFPFLIVAGVITSLAMKTRARDEVIVECAGMGLLLIALQVGIGFPLEDIVSKVALHDLAEYRIGAATDAALESARYNTEYTLWFWLALVFLAASAGTSLVRLLT
jgi:hypothetical protein